jgi:predicted lipoprotein with Yx(FWY)xxD motif
MRRLVTASLIPLVLVVAGCGSGGDGSGGSGSASSGTVSVSKSDLGSILVDSSGRTLYLFEKDKPGRSACSGKCAAAWPPLTAAGTPTAGEGISSKLLGTTKRGDGKLEVTYAGHPLYLYAGDHKAGDTAGQGLDQFGAEWYALDARGRKVEKEGDEKSSSPYGY